MITTDECQPKYKQNWPDPECPYGLILGADNECWHLEGYPTNSDPSIHEDHERISPETCEENPEHPFCWVIN